HEDQVGLLGPRQIGHTPGIDLNHLAGVLDLHAGMQERCDFDITPARRVSVGRCSGDRAHEQGHAPSEGANAQYRVSPSFFPSRHPDIAHTHNSTLMANRSTLILDWGHDTPWHGI